MTGARTWIALLRGVNVGGHGKVPMAALRAVLGERGFARVETYIQSGNVIFDAPTAPDDGAALAERLEAVIEDSFGFRPATLVLTAEALTAAATNNPFPEADDAPKTLHFFFLGAPAKGVDTEALDALRAPTERWSLSDNVFYLHAPDGIGRSRLAARAERLLGVPATARNYRTVAQLMAMVTGR